MSLHLLEDALNRCRHQDMPTPEVFAALDFLETRVSIKWTFDQFRKSLDSNNKEGRWQNVNASLNAVKLGPIRLDGFLIFLTAIYPVQLHDSLRDGQFVHSFI